mmetsp:Transcript_2352/g.5566  ORF Transcript_2352/g.5566 Transcript_2352/m.5566 type:complete len:303 (-) Transcript_2352:1699-2607(-)
MGACVQACTMPEYLNNQAPRLSHTETVSDSAGLCRRAEASTLGAQRRRVALGRRGRHEGLLWVAGHDTHRPCWGLRGRRRAGWRSAASGRGGVRVAGAGVGVGSCAVSGAACSDTRLGAATGTGSLCAVWLCAAIGTAPGRTRLTDGRRSSGGAPVTNEKTALSYPGVVGTGTGLGCSVAARDRPRLTVNGRDQRHRAGVRSGRCEGLGTSLGCGGGVVSRAAVRWSLVDGSSGREGVRQAVHCGCGEGPVNTCPTRPRSAATRALGCPRRALCRTEETAAVGGLGGVWRVGAAGESGRALR